ncbi:hypothetical protein IMSAG192_01674 [Muribaculaceae bacterium]|nr:hypothetical protein IMSAG192_01674 [Muribaculaceae bacterium]
MNCASFVLGNKVKSSIHAMHFVRVYIVMMHLTHSLMKTKACLMMRNN